MMGKVAVYLETGGKRVLAAALDWPGWWRGGKSEEEALQSLLHTAPRYAAIVGRAGVFQLHHDPLAP